MGVLNMLRMYLNFPFVRYALLTGVLIALCSSLLGVTLVLKRFAFIGDGLSHVAFAAMAVAGVMSLVSDMLIVLPVTILSAVWLLRKNESRGERGDALLAMISVGALAIGYLIVNLFSTSGNLSADVCTTLFGSTSILTLSKQDVWLCAAVSVVVVVVFIAFYNQIFAVTFDEDFAFATGMRTSRCSTLIAVITAAVIVLAMNLVGSLLTSALIVFPALSAMRVCRSYKGVILCSAALSVVCTTLGILISILASTPVGSTIVAADIAAYFAFCAVGAVAGR